MISRNPKLIGFGRISSVHLSKLCASQFRYHCGIVSAQTLPYNSKHAVPYGQLYSSTASAATAMRQQSIFGTAASTVRKVANLHCQGLSLQSCNRKHCCIVLQQQTLSASSKNRLSLTRAFANSSLQVICSSNLSWAPRPALYAKLQRKFSRCKQCQTRAV